MIKTDWKMVSLAILVIGLILGMAFGVSMAMGENVAIETKKVAVFVYDNKGNAVENATVEIITNTSQIIKSGYTNKDGYVIFDLNGTASFTGIIKVKADSFKEYKEDFTYNSTAGKGYAFSIILEPEAGSYVDKAKDIYDQHKTAVLVGGAVIILLLFLVVLGGKKKIKW